MTDATRSSYDRVAAQYAAEIGGELAGKPLDRALLNAFAELIGGPVVDVGGGPGHVADYLLRRGVEVVSTDISLEMCRLAGKAGLPSVGADMTALPFRSEVIGGIICWYAVIHLDAAQRKAAYAAFWRVLRPGGIALIAFHTRDADIPTGGEATLSSWWGKPVSLTFRFLDPFVELEALGASGFELMAQLDRAPAPGEHASDRTYLILRRPA